MSTSYNTIYDSFLSKIVDFDLPPLTDMELQAYCNRFMETAIVKLPDITSDLSKREVLEPEIITEVEAHEDVQNNNEEQQDEQQEVVVQPEPTTYVLYLDEPSYGNFTYVVNGLSQAVANDSEFILFVQVSNFIKLIKFTRGLIDTQECIIYDDFSCNIAYDGFNTFVFSNVAPRSTKYLLMCITYEEVNTDIEATIVPQPVEISDDVDQAIQGDGIITKEEVFVDDLTPLEIEIIASQMVVEWINNELNNTQLTRMFVGTKDESMASQANHIEKLTTLKEKRRADVSMMIRDFAYREWIKEEG